MKKGRDKDPLQLSDFEIGEQIGQGGFGTVYKAFWKSRNEDVAIKKISLKRAADRIKLEIENHQNSHHENIVKLYGHFKDNDEGYLVMELCKEGSLRNYIKNNGELQREQAASVVYQLVTALQYLHSMNITHRDLTSGNVLIKRIRNNGLLSCKICDFGLAKVMNGKAALHTMAGTPGYMDPQVANRGKYGSEVDLYSLGCILYVMLTAHEPTSKGKFPRLNDLDEDAQELINALTHPDPYERIRLDDVKKSAFLKETSGSTTPRHRSIDVRSSAIGRVQSVERRERVSINDRGRTKSRESLRERKSSISTTRSRPMVGPCTSTNHTQPAHLHSKCIWPLNIDRLSGKEVIVNEYRLAVLSDFEAILHKKNEKHLTIRIRGSTQRIGLECGMRGHSIPCFEHIQSFEDLDSSTLPIYNNAVKLLEKIKWKVAKIVFQNPSFYPGGTIRLMENDDLRVKDDTGRMLNIPFNSSTLYEGDPKGPCIPVKDHATVSLLFNIRQFCKDMELCMLKAGFSFPFISTTDKNVESGSKKSLAQLNNRMSSLSTRREENGLRHPLGSDRPRARSTQSSYRRPLETVMTHESAPSPSIANKENIKSKYIFGKNAQNEVRQVKEERSGTKLRLVPNSNDKYLFTDSAGREERFYYNGNMNEVPREFRDLLQRLTEARSRR